MKKASRNLTTAWLLVSFLPAVGLDAAERSYAKPKGWEQIVEAARREGTVVVYAPTQGGREPVLDSAFNKIYPGIRVLGTFGSGSDIGNRILSERRANRYIPDVLIGGTSTSLLTLKPAGALAPLRPYLLLPEVLDESAWLEKRLSWADAGEPFTTLMFVGYVQTAAYVNTKLVKPSQFKSYFDLLNPAWKGKIVASDIRRGGRGGVVARFMYSHLNLGPQFLERLFSEMDITFGSEPRQMVDWLANGRFPIALFLASDDITRAQEQGLPVAPVPAEQFKEGSPIAPAGGAVSLMDRATHPNAAKVFINWLLSREGQAAWQEAVHLPSLRTDISKKGLYPFDVPKPGIKYTNGGTEEFSRMGATAIRDTVTKALAKVGRQ